MKNSSLFNDFLPVNKQQWVEKLQTDLKGKAYEELSRTNDSGIAVEAIYNSESVQVENEAPGSGLFRRGSKNVDNNWVIDQMHTLTGYQRNDNIAILKKLNAGLTGITLNGMLDAETLMGVIPQHITLGFENYGDLKELLARFKSTFGESAKNANLNCNFDPIGNAALSGKWNQEFIVQGINSVKNNTDISNLKVFSVNAHQYHNAGATAYAEIGLALAQAHEYLVAMLEAGISIDVASAQIKINLAQGRDYFNEIAKIRAFRILWANLIEQYKPEHNCSKNVTIHAYTSNFFSTLYDPYVNMLRTTTQSMSAVVGGADIVTTMPYNQASKNENDFSERIARNTQLLLQEESYLNKVIDPAGGSYFVEYLTNQLADKAWTKFQKIEKKGGFIGLMTSGNLARELKEDAQEQLNKLENGKIQVLGVTLHPNMEENLDPVIKQSTEPNETDFNPIELLRLVETVEAERMNKNKEA